MSPLTDLERFSAMSFPRVSGDEPPVWDAICQVFTFSPRERG